MDKARKTKKERHENDERRLTAPERARAWAEDRMLSLSRGDLSSLAKVLEAHAAATLARAKARKTK